MFNANVLRERVAAFISVCGGVRKAARELNIDPGYLIRLRDGEKTNPSDDVAARLGLKKVVVYTDL